MNIINERKKIKDLLDAEHTRHKKRLEEISLLIKEVKENCPHPIDKQIYHYGQYERSYYECQDCGKQYE